MARKLAAVRRIIDKKPIEKADRIEAVRVDGWWVVTRKDEFSIGDLAVYFEIDSWVPYSVAPFLCGDKIPKEYNGMPGARLKTSRLRGQLSQGLLMPMSILETKLDAMPPEQTDVTKLLGVQLWEPQVRANQEGCKGSFPQFIPKTSQERIQNNLWILGDMDRLWEVSLKLDGTSLTTYMHEGLPGVCSRNMAWRLNAEDNRYVKAAKDLGLLAIVEMVFERSLLPVAIQGELIGPGIQGNHEKLGKPMVAIFDVFNIERQRYMTPIERVSFIDPISQVLEQERGISLNTAPVVQIPVSLYDLGVTDLDSMLALPEKLGREEFQKYGQPIEGLVFKSLDGETTFKVINNVYLEKKGG